MAVNRWIARVYQIAYNDVNVEYAMLCHIAVYMVEQLSKMSVLKAIKAILCQAQQKLQAHDKSDENSDSEWKRNEKNTKEKNI